MLFSGEANGSGVGEEGFTHDSMRARALNRDRTLRAMGLFRFCFTEEPVCP